MFVIDLFSKENYCLTPILHTEPVIAKLTENIEHSLSVKSQLILIWNRDIKEFPDGFLLVFIPFSEQKYIPKESAINFNIVLISEKLSYLSEDDIVKFYPGNNAIHVLYRKKSNSNSFLITERCNSFCIMCSQPPKKINDDYLVNDIISTLPLVHPDTVDIGITGGEPTLLGDKFIRIIETAKSFLPNTALHILSNGRRFSDINLAISVYKVKHHNLMIGIPLYADFSQLHDYIVQADNAFDETIKGILNLKRCKVPVEIRIVVHAKNYKRLLMLAEFITRNLLFVDHVAIMGLEITGFAKANIKELWIDPYYYRNELKQALDILVKYKVEVSIYNTPLCLIHSSVRKYSTRSISDWKNEYLPICEECNYKFQCSGFFSSNLELTSNYINPIK